MFSLFNNVITASIYSFASWILIVQPLRHDMWEPKKEPLTVLNRISRSPIVVGSLLWCLILPVTVTISKAPNDYLSDNVTFLYIKLWSVSIGVLSSSFFRYLAPHFKWKHEDRIRSITIATIIAVNMLEASIKQTFFHDNTDYIDYINGICGLIITVNTYLNTYKIPILIRKRGTITELNSQFRNSYIMSYTFWNILFVSKVAPEISFSLFLCVSHIVGIVAHFAKFGDWLEVRSQTLLFYIIFKFGITPNWRFFPEFFDPQFKTPENSLIQIITSDYYLIPLTVATVGCTVWSIVDTTFIYTKGVPEKYQTFTLVDGT
jgi:hypothetical protein